MLYINLSKLRRKLLSSTRYVFKFLIEDEDKNLNNSEIARSNFVYIEIIQTIFQWGKIRFLKNTTKMTFRKYVDDRYTVKVKQSEFE